MPSASCAGVLASAGWWPSGRHGILPAGNVLIECPTALGPRPPVRHVRTERNCYQNCYHVVNDSDIIYLLTLISIGGPQCERLWTSMRIL